MKNQDAQQAETTVSDESLAQVTGGRSVRILVKPVHYVGPVVSPQGPLFGVESDYQKAPFEQPR
ncbi:MAG: hypothetical protein RL033_36 [Pseudomonadota bacterium]|jgi:hypothetical protein